MDLVFRAATRQQLGPGDLKLGSIRCLSGKYLLLILFHLSHIANNLNGKKSFTREDRADVIMCGIS